MSLRSFWRGKKLLVTAGPTREPLDPVRYLTNASSGRMGYALAAAARRRGARVTLVSGPVSLPSPSGVKLLRVDSAREMLSAALKHGRHCDFVIGAAAVSDWRPARAAKLKLKKARGVDRLVLELRKNPDILKTLSKRRSGGRPRLAGFALETHALLANARRKLAEKSLDLIVANRETALDTAGTKAVLLGRSGATRAFAGPKTRLAEKILDALADERFTGRSGRE